MRKLILTSMLTAVGLFAQTNGNAPATQQKSNTTPAPAAQTPAQAPAKTAKHKHRKASSGTSTAVKPGTTGNDSSKAPANPAPANNK